MEPLSTLVSALVAGAAAALKPTAEAVVKDAYSALKRMIMSRSPKINIDVLESDPKSKSRQEVVKEDIQKSGVTNDSQVLELAKNLLEVIREHQPADAKSVGVLLEDIHGKTLLVNDIQSEGNGVKVQKADVEDIRISGVRAGSTKEIDLNP